jgi:hypothetical protein
VPAAANFDGDAFGFRPVVEQQQNRGIVQPVFERDSPPHAAQKATTARASLADPASDPVG